MLGCILFRVIACYSRFWGERWFYSGTRFLGCCDAGGGIARGQGDMIVSAQFELVADSGYLDSDETI